MSDLLNFNIRQGEVECDCMERTHNFISSNLKYLGKSITTLKSEGLSGQDFTLICYESAMSFAVKVDRIELGQIANGGGVIVDGASCNYDQILETLEST